MSLSTKTVLVVDDEEMLFKLVREGLKDLGCEFIYAANGKEGYEKAVSLKPNMIITDLIMFEMTGMEMLRCLFEQQIHIPSIMMTAYGSVKALKEAHALGIYDFIEKPVKLEEMRALVLKVLTGDEPSKVKADGNTGLLRNITMQIEADLFEKVQTICKDEGISLTTFVKNILRNKVDGK